MQQLTVSGAARRLKARPRDISDLFYRRHLRDDLCPIVGGRRLIPETYLPMIAAALRRRGRPVAAEDFCPRSPSDAEHASRALRHRSASDLLAAEGGER